MSGPLNTLPRRCGAMLVLALALGACEGRQVVPVGTLAVPAARLQANAGKVAGVVRAPAGYRVAALDERPVPGAVVRLVGLDGAAVADVPAVTADAQGRFAIDGLPVGTPFLVAAELRTSAGKPLTLKAYVVPIESEAQTDLSVGSTLLTALLLRGGPPAAGGFDPVLFNATAKDLAAAASLDQLPDWSDAGAVASGAVAIAARECALEAAIDRLEGRAPSVACAPSPSPSPFYSSGGGRSSSGGGAPVPTPTPATGGLQADIQISDGPRVYATPTPAAP